MFVPFVVHYLLMKRVGLGAAFLVCATAAAAVSPARAGSEAPEVVQRAASLNAVAMSGAFIEERHIDLNVSAGPAHYSEQNDAMVLIEDGAYKHMRYMRIVQNGKVLSADDLTQRESQNNDDLEHGKAFFKQPFDARYLRDYTYTDTACACGPHARQIAFHSDVRDDQHGDGTMVIDPSTGLVMNVTYTPNVLPQHASSATTVETFGEAVPGVWTVVRIDRTYGGHVAFIRGTGTMTERLDHFQRFGSPVAAMQYLQRASASSK